MADDIIKLILTFITLMMLTDDHKKPIRDVLFSTMYNMILLIS